MTGTIDIRLYTDHPDETVPTHYVRAGSQSCPRIVNVPQTIGTWEIETVNVTVRYPDNTTHTVEATNTDGTWIATLPPCSVVGLVELGFEVTADGTDESGETFEGLCLGVGDLEVLPREGAVRRGETVTFFRLVDTVPESPMKGDATPIGGTLQWYDGSGWIPFGEPIPQTAVKMTDEDTGEDYVLKVKGGVLKLYKIENE